MARLPDACRSSPWNRYAHFGGAFDRTNITRHRDRKLTLKSQARRGSKRHLGGFGTGAEDKLPSDSYSSGSGSTGAFASLPRLRAKTQKAAIARIRPTTKMAAM